MIGRRHVPGWSVLLAPVFEALLWPLVSACCCWRRSGARRTRIKHRPL
jgi:hypothetical protein